MKMKISTDAVKKLLMEDGVLTWIPNDYFSGTVYAYYDHDTREILVERRPEADNFQNWSTVLCHIECEDGELTERRVETLAAEVCEELVRMYSRNSYSVEHVKVYVVEWPE